MRKQRRLVHVKCVNGEWDVSVRTTKPRKKRGLFFCGVCGDRLKLFFVEKHMMKRKTVILNHLMCPWCRIEHINREDGSR